MTKLFIIIFITALAAFNLALGAPASYSSSIRGGKSILEGDLQSHQLKPHINAVVPELYARDPFFGRIFRGIKKAVGSRVGKVLSTVRQVVSTAGKVFGTARQVVSTAGKVLGTAKQVVGTAGKIASFIPRELDEVSEREYHDELFDRELDNNLFEREYDEELVRDFNDAAMDGLD